MRKLTNAFFLIFILSFTGCSLFQKKSNNAKVTESSPPNKTVVLSSEADEVELATDISGVKTALDKNSIVSPIVEPSISPAAMAAPAMTAPATSDPITQPESSSQETVANPKIQPNRNISSVTQKSVKSKKDELYKVKQGDTLMKISFEKYGNIFRWREIYNKNREKIPNYNRLTTGTVLLIEGVEYVVLVKSGKPYLIRRSDTLRKIAKSLYGTEQGWKSLWKNNRDLIHNPNKIYSGFTLYYLDQPQSDSRDQ